MMPQGSGHAFTRARFDPPADAPAVGVGVRVGAPAMTDAASIRVAPNGLRVSEPREVPPVATAPVLGAMLALAVALSVFSNGYGFHRDELYFRMLRPGWGYVDQPPLTPLLARLFSNLSDQPWAIRIPATAAALLSVYVLALITREFGGGRRAQALCAWAYSFAALPIIMGHVLLTSTIDFPVWPAVVLFIARAQLRRQPAWWLAAGAVVGVSTYNKLLVAVLLIALLVGVLLVGPRRSLFSRWVGAAALLALAIGSPNIVYQATNNWPQLSMGRALADHNAGDVHVLMWPFLLILLGPPLVPIWVAGLVSLLRRPEWRTVRFVAVAFPVLLVLVFVMGSQFYYPFGLLAVIFAIGCVPAAEWMRGWRSRLVVVGVALNAMVSLLLGLPIVPVSSLGSTPIPGTNQAARDTVGWPAYARQVAAAYHALPADDRAGAVIVTSNYGEAGAVARYGPALGLPAVYSGQNQLAKQAAPPSSANVVVFVGGQLDNATPLFDSCQVVGRLDNGVDVDNEEQGEPIAICRGPVGGWSAVWPRLAHKD
jgi:4-amino-4-deoxy-L-arabinose transferase-like glycosyltransferase